MATGIIHERDRQPQPRLTSEQVWRAIARASFAVLSHVTPAGEPRSSGVVYKTAGRKLVVAVAPSSWKARHIAAVTQDTVFRIGSITKTFTAIAVLQLCEQGLVDLDAPAGEYLRAYRLIPAKPAHRPPTVRQLLTHTAGLPQLLYPARAFQPVLGETVPYGQRVPALAEFYRGRLALIAEPGTRHTYSNHGFATLGQIIEDVTSQPLRRYFTERIFGPLGMTGTDLARSDPISARLATGYALRAAGPRPVRDCDLVTAGAGAIYSTTRDMARYTAALLAGGSGEHGQILKPETVTSMFAPHYQPDPRLPGVGLGFFRHDLGGHLLAGHDGLVPGFTSQMSLAPGDGTGVVALLPRPGEQPSQHGRDRALGTAGSQAAVLQRQMPDGRVRFGRAGPGRRSRRLRCARLRSRRALALAAPPTAAARASMRQGSLLQ